MTTDKSIDDVAPAGPIRSEVFEFRQYRWRWRLLDSREDIATRLAAQRHASDQLMNSLDIDRRESLELLQVGFNADILTEWHDWFRIGAALTTENGALIRGGDPVDNVQWLADEFAPLDRLDLLTRYLAFADEHDPANASDEELEEIIAASGKSPGHSRVLSCGSPVLRNCLHITAKRLHEAETKLEAMEEQEDLAERVEALELAISQTRKSSDGGDCAVSFGGESKTHDDKPASTGQAEGE